MDNYLEHLIKQVLDNDTGKLERYYKNEINKDGVSREAIIYKYSLGQAKIDDLHAMLKTDKLPDGKGYIDLIKVRYDVRRTQYNAVELASIISMLRIVSVDGNLNLEGYFEIIPSEKDFRTNLGEKIRSAYTTSAQNSANNFYNTLDELLNSINVGNKEEFTKFKSIIKEMLE